MALGIAPGRGSEESINRISLVSTARCPILDLGLCELESFRQQGSTGEEGRCSTNCTAQDYVQVEEEKCPFVNKYPSDLWTGVGNAGLSYAERVCCVIGETAPSDQCPLGTSSRSISKGALVGFVVAGGVLFVLCAVLCWWCLQPVDDDEDSVRLTSPTPAPPIIVDPPSPPSSSVPVAGPVLVVGEVLPPSTVTVVAEPESPANIG